MKNIGLAAAYTLQKGGHDVTVLEKSDGKFRVRPLISIKFHRALHLDRVLEAFGQSTQGSLRIGYDR